METRELVNNSWFLMPNPTKCIEWRWRIFPPFFTLLWRQSQLSLDPLKFGFLARIKHQSCHVANIKFRFWTGKLWRYSTWLWKIISTAFCSCWLRKCHCFPVNMERRDLYSIFMNRVIPLACYYLETTSIKNRYVAIKIAIQTVSVWPDRRTKERVTSKRKKWTWKQKSGEWCGKLRKGKGMWTWESWSL